MVKDVRALKKVLKKLDVIKRVEKENFLLFFLLLESWVLIKINGWFNALNPDCAIGHGFYRSNGSTLIYITYKKNKALLESVEFVKSVANFSFQK